MMSFEEDVLGTLRPQLLSCSIYIRNVKVIMSCLDLETVVVNRGYFKASRTDLT